MKVKHIYNNIYYLYYIFYVIHIYLYMKVTLKNKQRINLWYQYILYKACNLLTICNF